VKKEKKEKKENSIVEENTDEAVVANPVDHPITEDAEAKIKSTAKRATKIGTMLKEIRLEKGLKLPDISKKLCIRKDYIEAIESNNYREIPPFPYGIGFIRSYAKLLGLNSENIVELYKEEINVKESKNIQVLQPQSEATLPSFQYLIISVIALVILGFGWLFFSEKSEQAVEDEKQQETSLPEEDGGVIIVEDYTVQPTSSDQLPQEEVETPSSTDFTENQIKISDESYQDVSSAEDSSKDEKPASNSQAEDKPLEIPSEGIFIEVLEETWIEVKDETKLYISKVLMPGASYKVPEGSGMILSAGKSEGINVYVNGVLTKVVNPNKKMNIALDDFLKENR